MEWGSRPSACVSSSVGAGARPGSPWLPRTRPHRGDRNACRRHARTDERRRISARERPRLSIPSCEQGRGVVCALMLCVLRGQAAWRGSQAQLGHSRILVPLARSVLSPDEILESLVGHESNAGDLPSSLRQR